MVLFENWVAGLGSVWFESGASPARVGLADLVAA